MVKLEQIKKIFKSDILNQAFVALNDVSFNIPDGSLVGFLGANGAGKTTSLKIMMDFIRADEGQVVFANHMGSNKLEIFKKIGFLPERPYFYPNLTGTQFLRMLGNLSDMSNNQVAEKIRYWGPRFNIEYAMERKLRTYSKGMLQRIGFLAAIVHDPQFIILDEPLSGMDPVGRKEMKEVIGELHKQGKTIFFSSHVVPDIEEICDRVIFLEKGKLIYDGSVQSLIHSDKSTMVNLKVHTKIEYLKNIIADNEIVEMVDLGSDYYSLKIRHEDKLPLMTKLTSSGIDLIHLDVAKPTLEEIFYKIKQR